MKITYSAAASLDGFIAREDGDVSWLDEMDIGTNDTGLEEFFGTIDGLVMGRKTYDFVFNYGSWPYEDKPTWVCTHSDLEPLEGANLIIADAISTTSCAGQRAEASSTSGLLVADGWRLPFWQKG